jgi:hypothetical protein
MPSTANTADGDGVACKLRSICSSRPQSEILNLLDLMLLLLLLLLLTCTWLCLPVACIVSRRKLPLQDVSAVNKDVLAAASSATAAAAACIVAIVATDVAALAAAAAAGMLLPAAATPGRQQLCRTVL